MGESVGDALARERQAARLKGHHQAAERDREERRRRERAEELAVFRERLERHRMDAWHDRVVRELRALRDAT